VGATQACSGGWGSFSVSRTHLDGGVLLLLEQEHALEDGVDLDLEVAVQLVDLLRE
jgi:hypothetical protein